MRILLITLLFCFIAIGAGFPSWSTIFPYFFGSRSSRSLSTTPMPPTAEERRDFNHRTIFKTSKTPKPRRVSIQVSFGPIIYPGDEGSVESTSPMSAPRSNKSTKKPTTSKTTTTTTEVYESEEEILSEGFTTKGTTTTTTTTKKPPKSHLIKHLQQKFPKIHEWLYETNSAERKPRMPPHNKHLHTKQKEHPKKHQIRPQYGPPPPPPYPKRPKHKLVPPTKNFPKKVTKYMTTTTTRRPETTTTRRPRTTTTRRPMIDESEEDVLPGGFTTPSPTTTTKRQRTRKPTTTIPSTTIRANMAYEQYPAQTMKPFDEETGVLPGGQNPQGGYTYKKPEISKEVFFFEPPVQFAPSKAKPYIPKPTLKPKKQYKVIFIKAPEPEPPIIPDIPQIQPAPEQKTMIYVVAKKPEEPPNITIEAPPEPKSQKPDVFFIRYKVTTVKPDENEDDVQAAAQTTKAPDESEEDIQPGGQTPIDQYLPPKPDETETDIQPGGQESTPGPTYLPPIDDSDEQIDPGSQEPTNEYLPPDDFEESIEPGSQELIDKPSDQYLPPKPDETESETLPGNPEETALTPPKPDHDEEDPPNPTYLPPTEIEEEEEILPGGYLPPEEDKPEYNNAYLPPAPEPNNKYLPAPYVTPPLTQAWTLPPQAYPISPSGFGLTGHFSFPGYHYPKPPSYGGYEQKFPYGGYEQKPHYGGYEQKPQYGGYEQKPQYGGYEQKPQYGGYEQKPQVFGGYDLYKPHAFGGYEANRPPSGYGGYEHQKQLFQPGYDYPKVSGGYESPKTQQGYQQLKPTGFGGYSNQNTGGYEQPKNVNYVDIDALNSFSFQDFDQQKAVNTGYWHVQQNPVSNSIDWQSPSTNANSQQQNPLNYNTNTNSLTGTELTGSSTLWKKQSILNPYQIQDASAFWTPSEIQKTPHTTGGDNFYNPTNLHTVNPIGRVTLPILQQSLNFNDNIGRQGLLGQHQQDQPLQNFLFTSLGLGPFG